jgi:hypothetical protein
MVYDLFNSSSQISSAHIKFSDFICLFPFPFPLFPSAAKQIPLKRKEKKNLSFLPNIFSATKQISSYQQNKNKKKFQNFILTLFPLLFSATKPIPKKKISSPRIFSATNTNQYQPKLEKKISYLSS